MRRWFNRVVLARRWATFLLMGLSFLCFGVGTVNLFLTLKGTIGLLSEYGWQAAMDGGLQQLVELLLSGYASMAGYVVFKACEHSLVRHIVDPGADAAPPGQDSPRD